MYARDASVDKLLGAQWVVTLLHAREVGGSDLLRFCILFVFIFCILAFHLIG